MEDRKLKRQQRTVGSIVKIPLENGYHTYARVLDCNLAFYDCRTKEDLLPDVIVKSPVLFVVSVFSDIITQGYWLKVGKVLPIESHLIELENQPVYTEDFITGAYTIYHQGKQIPATLQDVIGLESFTVWDYRSIEERINDHYAGRFNQDVYDGLNGRQTTGMIESCIKIQQNLKKSITV